ncbi:MAG: hypothetical protein ACTTIV_02545 [Campylobacter sp.]
MSINIEIWIKICGNLNSNSALFLCQIFQPSAGKFMNDKSSNLFKIQD